MITFERSITTDIEAVYKLRQDRQISGSIPDQLQLWQDLVISDFKAATFQTIWRFQYI